MVLCVSCEVGINYEKFRNVELSGLERTGHTLHLNADKQRARFMRSYREFSGH